MFKYPFSKIPQASSVILIRKTPKNNFDYEISLFKRAEKTKFGGMFAFPGGVVEDQD